MKKIIKNKLFPYNGDTEIWNKTIIDDETISYISLPIDAQKISDIICEQCVLLKFNPMELIITDATSGAGGNVLSFTKIFKHINAIEIDAKRYSFLSTNIDAYKLNNVTLYCDNCLNIIHELYHNIVFFDPPWGGKDYKDKLNLRLKLMNNSLKSTEKDIEHVCIELLDKNITKYVPDMIVLKLPKNYDIKYLYDCLNFNNNKIILHNLNKMIIVLIIANNIES